MGEAHLCWLIQLVCYSLVLSVCSQSCFTTGILPNSVMFDGRMTVFVLLLTISLKGFNAQVRE